MNSGPQNNTRAKPNQKQTLAILGLWKLIASIKPVIETKVVGLFQEPLAMNVGFTRLGQPYKAQTKTI